MGLRYLEATSVLYRIYDIYPYSVLIQVYIVKKMTKVKFWNCNFWTEKQFLPVIYKNRKFARMYTGFFTVKGLIKAWSGFTTIHRCELEIRVRLQRNFRLLFLTLNLLYSRKLIIKQEQPPEGLLFVQRGIELVFLGYSWLLLTVPVPYRYRTGNGKIWDIGRWVAK